jgi:hypothetical protein
VRYVNLEEKRNLVLGGSGLVGVARVVPVLVGCGDIVLGKPKSDVRIAPVKFAYCWRECWRGC